MENDIKALTQALESNLELVQLMSKRIEGLENQVEENAAQRMALMLLLRAVVQTSPNRDQVAALAERMTDQMHVQPGILLHGGMDAFRRTRAHVEWMTAPGQPLG